MSCRHQHFFYLNLIEEASFKPVLENSRIKMANFKHEGLNAPIKERLFNICLHPGVPQGPMSNKKTHNNFMTATATFQDVI